jgi:hypothetical protein
VLSTLIRSWLGRNATAALDAPPEHGAFLRKLAAARGPGGDVAAEGRERSHSTRPADGGIDCER